MSVIEENQKYELDREPEVIIPLENFKYSNSTSTESNETESTTGFLGRTKELARLEDHLISGHMNNSFRGSILVAGYRGAGKTRFVNEALKRYKSNPKYEKECEENYVEVKINLGSEKNINSKTVLFNMVSLLMSSLEKRMEKMNCPRYLIPVIGSGFFQFLLFALFLTSIFYYFHNILISPFRPVDGVFYIYCSLGFLSIINFILLLKKYKFYSKYSHSINELHDLQKNMYATSEKNLKLSWGSWGGIGSRMTTKPLDNNQIESRIQQIIQVAVEDYQFKIVFIFDELDKLSVVATDKSDASPDAVRESQLRKQQVDSVLGDLKNLITSSNAIYIFIAGRDMYDAYLSERGSSNSLYESLFNDHIYISSFLTERSNGQVYLLDSMIEALVISYLIPTIYAKDVLKNRKTEEDVFTDKLDFSNLRLSDYVNYKKKVEEERIEKEVRGTVLTEEEKTARRREIEDPLIENIYILKTFIHFLTLHSWGNCKRLFTLFESFVRAYYRKDRGCNKFCVTVYHYPS